VVVAGTNTCGDTALSPRAVVLPPPLGVCLRLFSLILKFASGTPIVRYGNPIHDQDGKETPPSEGEIVGLGSTKSRPTLLVRARDNLPLIDEHNERTGVCHRGDLKDGSGRRSLGRLRVRLSVPEVFRPGLPLLRV